MDFGECERCGEPSCHLIECRRDSTLNWCLCPVCIPIHVSNLLDHWIETDECIDQIKEIIER